MTLTWQDIKQDFALDVGYQRSLGCPTPTFNALLNTIAWLWNLGLCYALGHQLASDEYGGPESGMMGPHCTRCGQDWNVVLY